MSSAEPIVHLPRADSDKTFCGEQLTTGTLLSSRVDAATCDACIQTALAENAEIVDRREEANRLEEILRAALGSARTIHLKRAIEVDPAGSTIRHFPIELAEMADVPDRLYGEMLVDLPAFVLSTPDWYPTPYALVHSMVSFFLESLKRSVEQKMVTPAQAQVRVEQCIELVKHCRKYADFEREYPVTADQWPEEFHK